MVSTNRRVCGGVWLVLTYTMEGCAEGCGGVCTYIEGVWRGVVVSAHT